jgi:syntaxin 18
MGALGSWAAGGAGQSKSYEQEQEESRANTISQHRESVLWYLRQNLQECGSLQASMMEKRILREVEKSKSVLAKSRTRAMSDAGGFEGFDTPSSMSNSYSAPMTAHMESSGSNFEQNLTDEQFQMFEKENQDMLKHYESTLDQVK